MIKSMNLKCYCKIQSSFPKRQIYNHLWKSLGKTCSGRRTLWFNFCNWLIKLSHKWVKQLINCNKKSPWKIKLLKIKQKYLRNKEKSYQIKEQRLNKDITNILIKWESKERIQLHKLHRNMMNMLRNYNRVINKKY